VIPPQSRSDAELASQLKAGDVDALGQLYERHVGGIHDYLARFTRDPAAAEDLAQTTFLRAWEGRAALRDPSKVRAWLYATAHHLALNHVTRARATSIDDEAAGRIADPARGPEEEAIAREAADLVWAAASSLEARQYAVLDLSVRQGLTTREIADVLDVPVAHAAVLVNRGREALGNAVRYLMVARRRDHCERLAELVPAGVRVLTAQERSAVDHHMRRCETCRELGLRLTAPAQLLGALLPLPLPASLGDQGRQRLVASVHAQPAAAAQAAGGSSWPPRRTFWDGRGRLVTGLAIGLALLVLGGGAATYLLRTPAGRQPGVGGRAPAAGPAAPAAAGPAVAGPATSPSPTVAPAPTPSPSGSGSTAAPQPGAGTTGSTTSPGGPSGGTRPTPAPTSSGGPGPPGGGPTPTPVTPTPTPTSTPPPLVVLSVEVRAQGGLGCLLNGLLGLFGCDFTVLVEVAGGTGQDVVQVTLTATPNRGRPVSVTVPARANVPTAVTVTIAGPCPAGVASAVTAPRSLTPSNQAPFGRC
jgi:RNA polymerase sigma factor (sigma-70 family)